MDERRRAAGCNSAVIDLRAASTLRARARSTRTVPSAAVLPGRIPSAPLTPGRGRVTGGRGAGAGDWVRWCGACRRVARARNRAPALFRAFRWPGPAAGVHGTALQRCSVRFGGPVPSVRRSEPRPAAGARRVDRMGFEPTTPSMPWRCAARLRYRPEARRGMRAAAERSDPAQRARTATVPPAGRRPTSSGSLSRPAARVCRTVMLRLAQPACHAADEEARPWRSTPSTP